MHQPTQLSPALAGAFVLAWSSGYIAGPAAVGAMQPLTVLVARFGGSGLLAVALVLALRRPLRMPRGDVLRQAGTGVMFNAVMFGAMFLAFDRGMGATVGALLHSLSPVLTALLAGALLGERLRPIQVGGFALGVLGVVVVLGPDLDGAGAPLALGLGVLSVFALSFGTLGQRWLRETPDPLWSLLIQCAASLPPLVVAASLLEWQDGFGTLVSDPTIAALSLAWLIGINTLVGLALLALLVRQAGAGAAATTFFLMPPVTAVMAWFTLGESINLRQGVGLLIAAIGVAAATRQAAPHRGTT